MSRRPMSQRPTSRRRRWIGVSAAAAIGVVAALVLYTVWLAGELSPIAPHFAGTCVAMPGVVGAEDLALDRLGERVFLSAIDRRGDAARQAATGGLWSLDLGDANARPVRRTHDLGFPFHPHGVGLARSASATVLMVVNHRGGGHVFEAVQDTIEVFAASSEGELTHLRSVADALLRSVNDVAPLTEGRFYATIDHGEPAGFMRKIEDYTRRPWASVVLYNGRRARTVADGLRYANGVALSADGSELYVAATVDRAIFVYRVGADGGLRQLRRIETGTGVDNITVDGQGTLWLGAHPKLLTFLRHAADASVLSPSQVLKVDPRAGSVEEILLDDGSRLSGSAAAVPWGDRLLIGPVFDDHLLDCRLGR